MSWFDQILLVLEHLYVWKHIEPMFDGTYFSELNG